MVEEVIGDIDLILVMSVNPGFGGQTFIPGSLRRITALADAVRTAGAHAVIEVDGGIDAVTARQVVAAGADVLVAGSYIFEAPSMKDGIAALRASASEGLRTRSGDSPRIA
jgi:ribulose-phosphate 3-epimerase